jgi:hypothetical protein
MIDTREELLDALQIAAELEHGLMLQYLFAALSIKKDVNEGLTGGQYEAACAWEGQIMAVAREEMAHLGTVCNLLSAVGGAPHFGRPNFPQPPHQYYPFGFALTRFSDATLYRFIRFEQPAGTPPPDPPRAGREVAFANVTPDPVEYDYIGQLYQQIRQAFDALPEGSLFIGPRHAQDVQVWSRRMQILNVVDRSTANTAIDFIVQEGEGAPGHRDGSHYDTFLKIRAGLAQLGAVDLARPVISNPRTDPHPDAPADGTLLTNPAAVELCRLFNACYEIVLLLLAQLYSYGGETLGERAALRSAARQLMTMAIRPIAETLTRLPAGEDPNEGTAGPTFELYAPFQLSTQTSNRWTILFERLDAVGKDAASRGRGLPRLRFVGGNILLISDNLRAARATEHQL